MVTVPSISDESLMLAFQDGSRHAFEELFARYRAQLFGFFQRRLLNPTRAEDLTQDTFVAVVTAIGRYQPQASVRAYLYGIAFNLLAAERRKQFRDLSSPASAPEPPTSSDTTQILWLRQALSRLDDSDREILMLREFEQLSYAEIAELLAIPLNTVRSRLFRARMTLKSHLEASRAPEAITAPPGEAATPLDTTATRPTRPAAIPELNSSKEEGLA